MLQRSHDEHGRGMMRDPLHEYRIGPAKRPYDLIGIFVGTLLIGLMFLLMVLLLPA